MAEVRRLRYIYHGNFRKTEETLFREALEESKITNLRGTDCVMLVSGTGKHIKFVDGFNDIRISQPASGKGVKTRVLTSESLRITGPGGWNPMMIANYAAKVGIHLEGLLLYEDAHQKMRQLKRERAKELRVLRKKKDRRTRA